MMKELMKTNNHADRQNDFADYKIITAGSNYQDIDAYACCCALAELLRLKGERAIAYSQAPCNYSVCKSLLAEGQVTDHLPQDCSPERAKYIIADVSDPDYIRDVVPLEQVEAVYDHHVGFEEYWTKRLGKNAHIEFIGAAATLICREWKEAGLYEKMSRSTTLLLIAAILDNTLNLTSSNTSDEDIETFRELCKKEGIDQDWCAEYFAEVQTNVEADLKHALFNDLKMISNNTILPPRMTQLCVWNADSILARVSEISNWFSEREEAWMINIIDLQHRCSWFVCDNLHYQKALERTFDVCFEDSTARSNVAYLRKEMIKKTYAC